MSRQKSFIRTKLILDCLTILQNICEVVAVKTIELKISRSQRIWPAPVILIKLEKLCHFTGVDSKFKHVRNHLDIVEWLVYLVVKARVSTAWDIHLYLFIIPLERLEGD